MSKILKIKSGIRVGFAMAVIVAALVAPTQAMAQEDCNNSTSDPAASQYCSVAGTNADHGSGPSRSSHGVKGVQSSGSDSPATVEPAPEAVGTTTSSQGSSSLPFTGLDVGILAVVAAALAGSGLILRRLTSAGVSRR